MGLGFVILGCVHEVVLPWKCFLSFKRGKTISFSYSFLSLSVCVCVCGGGCRDDKQVGKRARWVQEREGGRISHLNDMVVFQLLDLFDKS
jgi:hypothetical protein